MASSKKKQDEKNLVLLREILSSHVSNKQCFDCHQRGPTYVNMTIGSFVCTSCSGILRGINPPHRVKSVSMASFTAEEIEFIKGKGNQYSRLVWLGTYDPVASGLMEPDGSNEQSMKEFIMHKYEKKRWYVDPSIALKNSRVESTPPQQQIASGVVSVTSGSGVPDTKPIQSLLGNNVRPLVVQSNQQTGVVLNGPVKTSPLSSRSAGPTPSSTMESLSAKVEAIPKPLSPPAAFSSSHGQLIKTRHENALPPPRPAVDLFANFNNDLFADAATAEAVPIQPATAIENFANFDNFPTVSNIPTIGISSSTSTQHFKSNSASESTFGSSHSLEQTQKPRPASEGPYVPPPPPKDRYAALEELDTYFNTAKEIEVAKAQTNNNPVPDNDIKNSPWAAFNGTATYTADAPGVNPFSSSPMSGWNGSQNGRPATNSQLPVPASSNPFTFANNAQQQPQPITDNFPTVSAQKSSSFTSPAFPANFNSSPTNGNAFGTQPNGFNAFGNTNQQSVTSFGEFNAFGTSTSAFGNGPTAFGDLRNGAFGAGDFQTAFGNAQFNDLSNGFVNAFANGVSMNNTNAVSNGAWAGAGAFQAQQNGRSSQGFSFPNPAVTVAKTPGKMDDNVGAWPTTSPTSNPFAVGDGFGKTGTANPFL